MSDTLELSHWINGEKVSADRPSGVRATMSRVSDGLWLSDGRSAETFSPLIQWDSSRVSDMACLLIDPVLGRVAGR